MKHAYILLFLALPLSALAEKRDRPLAEMEASVVSKASKLDTNGDGILSDGETLQGREKLGMLSSAVSRKVDSNQDGIITRQEYERAQVEELRSADTNKDGILTVEEQKRQQRKLIGQLLGG